MDEQEASIYQSMPDYEDIDKQDIAPAVPEEPSDGEATDDVSDTEEATTETESEEDQPDTEEAKPEEPSEPEKYTVKVGDKEEEVTLEELKQSYMRTADYTRKTTELAEKRRALEAQAEQRQQEIDRMQKLFAETEASLSAALQTSEARELRKALNSIDVKSLSDEDMQQYMRVKAHCEQLEAKERQQIEAFNAQRQKFIEEQKRLDDERFHQDQALLMEEIPEFKDPVKREQLNKDITAFMVSIYGEKRARELAPQIRTRDDYKTLYYAAIGKKFLETKAPAASKPKTTNLSAKGQAGAQTVTQPSVKKTEAALLQKIKSRGERAEASDSDIIKYLSMKG